MKAKKSSSARRGHVGTKSRGKTRLPYPQSIFIPASILALLLGGCAAVGPDYKSPAIQMPVAYKNAPAAEPRALSSNDVRSEAWWRGFGDPALDELEEAALAHNPSLEAVAARVAEARARLGVTRADRYPNLTNTSAGKLAGESSEQIIPLPGNPVRYRQEGDSYRTAFDASYELDMWGRVRRSLESAQAQYASAEADERGARLSLCSDVAQTYLSLKALDAEQAVLKRTLENRRALIEVLEARAKAGYSAELDLHKARAEKASVEAESVDLARRRELLVNGLAVLCGKTPSDLSLSAGEPKLPALPVVPAGLPADMLARRPDLASTEALYRARTAEIGVAEAARYPSIKLTASGGFESADLGKLLERPAQFWQLGPSLTVPLLDGGRLKANVEAAAARAEQARADHRQKTLQALREVEDCLVDLRQQALQQEAINQALESSELAHKLAEIRYYKGLVNYLEVIDAQRGALQYERSKVQLEGARLQETVKLIRALGGGWAS